MRWKNRIEIVTTLIYIHAPFSDLALRARERLVPAQLGESSSELRAPVIDIRGVLYDERTRPGVHGEFGIDPHETLLGQQVDVVVVVEQHRRLLVVPEVREVDRGRVLRASVPQHVRECWVQVGVYGWVDPLVEALTVRSSNGVSTCTKVHISISDLSIKIVLT